MINEIEWNKALYQNDDISQTKVYMTLCASA